VNHPRHGLSAHITQQGKPSELAGASGRAARAAKGRSILAEIEELGALAHQEPIEKLLAAVWTEVQPNLLEHLVTDLVALGVFESLEDILDFLKVVAIVIAAVVDWIKSCGNLNSHDKSQLNLGIEVPFAEIARVMDHHSRSPALSTIAKMRTHEDAPNSSILKSFFLPMQDVLGFFCGGDEKTGHPTTGMERLLLLGNRGGFCGRRSIRSRARQTGKPTRRLPGTV
jgi:hypothetical protein